MDTPVLIILGVFALIVVVLAFRYRRQLAEEVQDLLDDDEPSDETKSAAQPPAPTPDEELAEPAPEPEPALELPEPVVPPRELPPISPGPTRGGESPTSPQPAGEAPGTAITVDQVKMSAYYPRETAPQVWQPLVAYIFRQSAARDVIQDVGQVLGARLSEMRRIDDSARQHIQEGAFVTAIPNLPGFQINPPQITLGFYEPFHRFEFKARATSAPLEQAANGSITFTVEGVIAAELPVSIFVGKFAGEALTGAVTKAPYQTIFCSYSHQDTKIVERVERAYKALGMTYLRDVMTLRSGQNWNAELIKLIEQAEIFQLFWSQKAADSKYVRQEWEYALKTQRSIRPVYWEQPLPNVPSELGHLHFAYMPELVE